MKINEQTQFLMSASARPGRFGATIYQAIFELQGINAIYLPRRCENAEKLIEAIRTLDILGCSVSMPLKNSVVRYLDQLDSVASKAQSVNTIVNRNGRLKGFNTDFSGAREVLNQIAPRSALIYGAGSVTQSIALALRAVGCKKIGIHARRQNVAASIAKAQRLDTWKKSETYDLLINATPIRELNEGPELFALLPCSTQLFDLVVSPSSTSLQLQAKRLGLAVTPGVEMALWQLVDQFGHYFGEKPDPQLVRKLIQKLYLSKPTALIRRRDRSAKNQGTRKKPNR